ncbi:unnamed protein product, partial [Linum tenue]
ASPPAKFVIFSLTELPVDPNGNLVYNTSAAASVSNLSCSVTEGDASRMEEGSETGTSKTLVFAVNGCRFELSDVDPSTTLIELLRTRTPFKSVKLGCGEGGCGACVVLLSKYDEIVGKVEDFTISACLTLLCSLHGCSITTTEGLGNSKDRFHPIHERFAGFHASQCGFCTPGMCMSLYGALVNAGISKLTAFEAEEAIAGNLCRCTGY